MVFDRKNIMLWLGFCQWTVRRILVTFIIVLRANWIIKLNGLRLVLIPRRLKTRLTRSFSQSGSKNENKVMTYCWHICYYDGASGLHFSPPSQLQKSWRWKNKNNNGALTTRRSVWNIHILRSVECQYYTGHHHGSPAYSGTEAPEPRRSRTFDSSYPHFGSSRST